ncbi:MULTISPECIES: biotin transporter BioY [unclassified Shinella]|uniref:biotin transporter BioY n=1 Tax=unclassified Shinella TaxID=2643062 RepID=UPI00225DA0E8|nr:MULTISPECIES: biotin transporter BioY [unclassified Shinella]MCO5136364.1 biotin transporter BioY [Shinella sp.]MDC7253961.1 biotin transporter BioY [Shinella sp. YE25]CAI0336618.1 Biotin transporter [Rhizobiaceae bacterium]CAK7255150.1 Biotin transporter [Shinella sp. WSC3-e]
METRDTVFIATFAAITAALAVFPPMTLPVVGVPITAQSLGAILAGGVLGARRGGLSMILFLILVAIGLPLLSGGRGGFGVFMGPTGGFLLRWVVTSSSASWWNVSGNASAMSRPSSPTGGIVVLYGIGIAAGAQGGCRPQASAWRELCRLIPPRNIIVLSV